ncbi:NAD(P)-dependent oxidoreductase [Flavobacterium johnsoniae]|uniref:Saccharopine dehydrogenase [NAD(+), L-lysine-forming] n=1 Tax=Flavobacterium johnsoniae (strain ATCC 17061 / DSM 2064 / JCM 8514 / BCRC 14874 / CCUG 350202 / NBRC 14942 / NCIMB 11054 / UW101) TaxID=376686 RepID=A5FAH7_FLAJ1|nr:NAD(P)-dependent oxidoreductase [Flavobacterium johnsoniae]ABQ07786.1 alanine dehydrogenase/PNT domain protein [Flavobacterium johnsoniae UW101]OXG01869.1 alanine dehydrogenase [Flavobacterium johnsoniae UW101]WQG80371.1 NAD(P)-dependent oxidoreductase [Flavobacterium johnsoniae UW101]SHL02006.1 Alanine dehydrogenase [Flavobacterium johnsoniae]
MKFGIIKERKNPPDRRVVFSPNELTKLKQSYHEASVEVESSDIRIFSDEAYKNMGITVTDDISNCDVLFGVKEVPVENLIPNKAYFFFSHTIKKQPHNRKLLQAVLEKNIDLYDHETIVDAHDHRLIGFGKYAGMVGVYNGIRAFGIKFELFKLPKAESLSGKDALIEQLKRITMPALKFVVTGTGKVGSGAKEILDAIKVKEITVDNYLTKKYTQAVYVQLDVLEYNKRLDGQVLDFKDFVEHPQEYTSDFEKFTKVSDIYFAGHFHANNAPMILTREMLNASDCKLKVVADISCDVNGPIACTIRSSTIEEPLYGYFPFEDKEVDFFHPAAVAVMAVDNLPCEIPKDASEGFGEQFMEHVIPAFFNGDKDGILKRAKITENGKLTERFSYLQDYVNNG